MEGSQGCKAYCWICDDAVNAVRVNTQPRKAECIQFKLSAYCTTDGIQVKIWADDWVLFATVTQFSVDLYSRLTSV